MWDLTTITITTTAAAALTKETKETRKIKNPGWSREQKWYDLRFKDDFNVE